MKCSICVGRPRSSVVIANYLIASGQRNAYVGGRRISSIIVKREPACGIHQITELVADEGKPLVKKRTARRCIEHAGIFESQRYRCPACDLLPQIDSHAWAEVGNPGLILYKGYRADRNGRRCRGLSFDRSLWPWSWFSCCNRCIDSRDRFDL